MRRLGRVFRGDLRETRFKHEGERVFQLDRLQFGIAGVLEGLQVRPVRQLFASYTP